MVAPSNSRAAPCRCCIWTRSPSRSTWLAITKVKARVQTAIAEILANQGSDGSFGLWGNGGGGDGWLDAYVTDFLTRAREQGYRVPEVPFDMALDNLRNRLGYAADFSKGGEEIAYALYVLARNGRAAIGDLRYYADTKLDAFATPMAKAQLGAGLALYGDRPRADTVFRNALGMLSTSEDDGGWRADFGSGLRDGAALLTLAAETGEPRRWIRGRWPGVSRINGPSPARPAPRTTPGCCLPLMRSCRARINRN